MKLFTIPRLSFQILEHLASPIEGLEPLAVMEKWGAHVYDQISRQSRSLDTRVWSHGSARMLQFGWVGK